MGQQQTAKPVMVTTIAATTKELICEVDKNGIGLSINRILEIIHERHPGCKTTKACVSWYISQAKGGNLKNFEGTLPRERERSTGTVNVTTAPAPVVQTDAERWSEAASFLVNSEYSTPALKKALHTAMKKVDIESIIAAEKAKTKDNTEPETEKAKTKDDTEPETEKAKTKEPEAIPLTDEDVDTTADEVEATLSEEELAALVA